MTRAPKIVDAGQPRQIWWLHPAFPFAATSGVAALAAYLLPDVVYEQSWRTPKYFNGALLQIVALCILAFALGTYIGTRGPRRKPAPVVGSWADQVNWHALRAIFRVSFLLCLIGYISWAAVAVSRGISWDLILGAFTAQKGATYILREDYLGTVTGVTTLTQFGIAAVIIGVPMGIATGWRNVRWQIAIILGLALIRVMLNSERLAAIELVCPLVISWVYLRYTGPSRVRLRLPAWIRFAPVIGVVAVFTVFSGFEYFRSWITFYQGGSQTFLEFAAGRLLGYYATALNNGALIMNRVEWPLGAPFYTAHFLWRFPLLGPYIESMFSHLALNDPAYYTGLLDRGANPEFNNPDGIMLPVLDFGVGGGLLYWMIAGILVGAAYYSFIRKSPAGLFWYPTLFVSLIESPRILYWADGRFFPAACMLLLAVLVARKRLRRLPFIAAPHVQSAASAGISS